MSHSRYSDTLNRANRFLSGGKSQELMHRRDKPVFCSPHNMTFLLSAFLGFLDLVSLNRSTTAQVLNKAGIRGHGLHRMPQVCRRYPATLNNSDLGPHIFSLNDINLLSAENELVKPKISPSSDPSLTLSRPTTALLRSTQYQTKFFVARTDC